MSHALACGIVSLLVLTLGGVVLWKGRGFHERRVFGWLCLTMFGWLFSFSLAESSSDYGRALFFAKLGHSHVIFIPVVYLHFTRYMSKMPQLTVVYRVYYGISLLFLWSLWSVDQFIPGMVRHSWGFYPVGGPLMLLDATMLAVAAVAGWVIFAISCRRARQRGTLEEYNRLKYCCLGLTVFSFGALDYLPKFGVPYYPLGFLTTAIFVSIVSYAILVHRLMDVNIVIRKSLVYSLLIAIITALYLVMILIMEKWFQGFFGYRSVVATAIVAFVIALCFNPLRSRLQAFVDRALFHATPVELAAQREQLLAEVGKSDQMKAVATFAAGLAHEIKNPLTSIKTFTDHLPSHHTDPAFMAKFQTIVGGEVERINRIVQQLLDFAKPAPPQLKPLELTQLMDQTLELLSNECMAHRVEVTRDYAARPTVLGDPQQLKQIFLNLILNSLQAMNGTGQLKVATALKDRELLVTVADNGRGIAPQDLARVCDPFFTTKANGTGLGLTVVQGIIKEHGGRLSLTSTLGQGTTVSLFLPVVAHLHAPSQVRNDI